MAISKKLNSCRKPIINRALDIVPREGNFGTLRSGDKICDSQSDSGGVERTASYASLEQRKMMYSFILCT